MNGFESPQFGRHRLCRPLKNGRSDFNDFKGSNHFEDRGTTDCYLRIGKVCPDAEATQRPQTFDGDQRARNALVNIAPLAQGIGLPEGETEQYRRVYLRDHRCPWRSSISSSTTSIFNVSDLGSWTRLGGGVPDVGFRIPNALFCRTGTIWATGVSRSRTDIVSPRRTARRYSLSRDLSSAMPTCLIVTL